MNIVQSYLDQQLGFLKWNNYDIALKRLKCRKEEEFTCILPQSESGEQLGSDPPIFACKFAHVKGFQEILALANEDGKIAIYNTKTQKRYGYEAHNNAIFDIAWMPKVMKLVTASGDHTAALFDISKEGIKCERTFQGHIRSLKSVACCMEANSIFATGGRDGKLIIWDNRVAKSDVVCIPDILVPMTHFTYGNSDIKSTKLRDVVSASSSVTGLIFKDYNTVISCGAGDGLIKVWDIRKTYYALNKAPQPKYSLPYGGKTLRNGFSNLLMNSNSTKLYASCLDNAIYVYNIATYNPKPTMTYLGHKNSTFYVKACLSPDDKYILTGSSDNKAYIWNADSSYPLVELIGHDAEVTCVAWCEDGSNVLVTCSDDLRHKIWRVDISDNHNKYCNRTIECKSMKSKVTHSRKRKTISHTNTITKHNEVFDEFLTFCNDESEIVRKRPKVALPIKRKSLEPIDQNVISDVKPAKRFKFDVSPKQTGLIGKLPNFVIDGSAPHLNISPVKKQEKDWLTKLRLERLPVMQIQELSKSSPSKICKLDNIGASPKSKKLDTLPTISLSQSPLLKYFKITSNPTQQCRSKSPNSITVSPKSQSSQ